MQDDVIIEWEAPSRVFKRRGKDYFSTVAAVVFLICIVLFVLREFILILVVLTLAFFTWILATVKPEKIKHQITKKGVRIGTNFYLWNVLSDFWIEKKYENFVFHISMPLRPPGRVIFIVETEEERDKITKELNKKLVYHEEPIKSWVDKAADWLSAKIQLES